MTRIMDYVGEMLRDYRTGDEYGGFLGAYNMGLWGVSVTGERQFIQGTLCTGTPVDGLRKLASGRAPVATNHVKFYDTPNLWGFGDNVRGAPSEYVRSAYEHAAGALGLSAEQAMNQTLSEGGYERIEKYLKVHMGGVKWSNLAEWSELATIVAVQRAIDEAGAWTGLVSRWAAVIAQSQFLVDVTSLGAPVLNSEAQRGICAGIRECLLRWSRDEERRNNDAPLMIRLLFGNTGWATGGQTDWDAFLAELQNTLAAVNRFNSISGLREASPLPIVLLGSDFGRASKWANFNHSKIVAGDGQYALVGGHNMCEEVSSNRAPVIHDVTAEVTGPGARSANAFAGSVWMKAAESGRLWIHRFNWETNRFDDVQKDSAKRWAPDNYWSYDLGTQRDVQKVIKNQYWFYPMEKLPPTPAARPPEGSVPATAILGIGRWGDYKFFGVDGSGGLALDTPIAATHACHHASDILKRLMIADPTNTVIRMSQQDLVNAGNFSMAQNSYHTICEAIGRRLQATPRGTSIQVVVSTRYAQNSGGLSYSYGDGPREGAERISDTIARVNQASSSVKNLPARLAVLGLSQQLQDAQVRAVARPDDASFCTVAPLVFCAARGATRTRGSYVWPDARYVYEKLYGNNRFWDAEKDTKEAKMGPGNHAKVMVVSRGEDDATGLVMIGSDNMYPSPLSEFNFVIEGAEAVRAFRTQYWDNLWGYSARMGFTIDPRGNVT